LKSERATASAYASEPGTARASAARAAATAASKRRAQRADFLAGYQSRRWARAYEEAVAAARAAEARVAPGAEAYADAVARSLFKLMSYKDEYEVARLHAETLETQVAERFEGVERIEFHLAPPLLATTDAAGRPRKAVYGPWMLTLLRGLKRLKALRGTPLDPFGWTAERRGERAAIAAFRAEIDRLNARMTPETHALAVEIAALPQQVKGFGHVKAAAAEAAARRRAELWAAFDRGPEALAQAAE
jgi:indolepyruvate ferredoxin oxidoreductase